MIDDNELLNFPTSNLAHGEAGDARLLLNEHGDVFRAQLIAARWLERWRERAENSDDLPGMDDLSREFNAGLARALRDVIAHLRQGDFVPGGRAYEDEIKEI